MIAQTHLLSSSYLDLERKKEEMMRIAGTLYRRGWQGRGVAGGQPPLRVTSAASVGLGGGLLLPRGALLAQL